MTRLATTFELRVDQYFGIFGAFFSPALIFEDMP